MMESVRIVNDDGYKALQWLADHEPDLFITPSPQTLRERMVQEAGTDDVWGSAVELRASLDSLSKETVSGPRTDATHAKTLRTALPGLTPAVASDGYLWASINCFAIPDYVPVRWSTSNNKDTKPSNFVRDHWLQYQRSEGRKWNAAARLWWMGELASRVANYSEHNPDELLETMAGNVQFYHQTIDRTYLAANTKLLAVLYDVLLDGNEHLNSTKAVSDMLKSINLRAGATALDLMDYEELRGIVEEAKPPKG